jgi:hypothetical protein
MINEELEEYVQAKLLATEKMIDERITSLTLDAAEILLNDVARVYRDSGLRNNCERYRVASSLVAHARLRFNYR